MVENKPPEIGFKSRNFVTTANNLREMPGIHELILGTLFVHMKAAHKSVGQ